MRIVTITVAKKHFAQWIEKVANGEEVLITRRSTPVARLVKFAEVKAKPKPESMK